MKYFKKLAFLILLSFMSINIYGQQSSIYQRAADLCEAAAKKYDAQGCAASAAYCRKMKQWNLCMVNALAGKPNACGIEPLAANAPKCDGSTIGSASNSTSNTLEQVNKQQAQELNNAIDAAGNTIWDIIQSSKARKENTGKAIVNSFAKDLYERKKNIEYYDDVLCDECNGSGILTYNVNPNNILYGEKHPCEQCNGIGRINRLKPQYDFTFAGTHGQEFLDLATYLRKAISTKTPLCKLTPVGYKGRIEMKVYAGVGGHNDDLIFIVTTIFNFLDRNGKFDSNGYVYNSIGDRRIFPLNTIKSFEYIASQTKNIEGTLFEYNSHIIMKSITGETFEFTTDTNPAMTVNNLNELLNKAKDSLKAVNSTQLSDKLDKNANVEVTINYLNSRIACCLLDGAHSNTFDRELVKKYGALGTSTMPSRSNLKIQSIENGVVQFIHVYNNNQFKDMYNLNATVDCVQYNQDTVYLINCQIKDDNSTDTEHITKFIFQSSETAKEVFNALNRLKSF